MMKKTNRFQFGYLLLGGLLIAVGVLFLMFRDVPVKMALALGILLILSSAYLLAVALSNEKRGVLFVIRLVVAFAVMVGGTLTVIFRLNAAEYLIALFALALIIDGSFKLQLTASLKAYTPPLFWIMLVLATGVIAGAFIVLRFPLKELKDNSLLLGLLLILDGISNLFSPFGRASCEKAARSAQIVAELDVSEAETVKEEETQSDN